MGFAGEQTERGSKSKVSFGHRYVLLVHEANRDNEIRFLLTTLGRKYDQYLDFAQQDAHEFLRILLDAMRMEEFDVSMAFIQYIFPGLAHP